jgi:plastocyanin
MPKCAPKFAAGVRFSAIFLLAGAVSALAGEAARITIADTDFAPATVAVHIGDTVAWANKDIVDHTLTARNGAFDVVAAVGKSGRLRLTKSGTVNYYCRFHPNMVGAINVAE